MKKVLALALLAGCGSPSEVKIIGGKKTYKHFCALNLDEREGKNYRGICGSTLIGKRWALTAAHCVDTPMDRSRTDAVYIGAHTPWSNKNSGRPYDIVKVKRIISHPGYEPDKSRSNDIALLELERDSKLPAVQVARYDLKDGDKVKVYGFGQTSYGGNTSKDLLRVKVSVVESCNKLRGQVDNTMFCAGTGQGDSCGGDSGGPAIHKKALVGAVSWGYRCNLRDYPGVYARLDIDWLKKYVKDLNLRGEN